MTPSNYERAQQALPTPDAAANATAYALLAVADEIRATRQATHPERPAWDLHAETVAGTGRTNYYTQDGQPATPDQIRAYLDSVNPPPPEEEPEDTTENLAATIDELAADLWAADPGNKTPARTFHEDYATSQDRYRAMAMAALGLTDEPSKDHRP